MKERKKLPIIRSGKIIDKIIGYADLSLKIIMPQNKMHMTSFHEILYTLLYPKIRQKNEE